jgi:hypothetical protein
MALSRDDILNADDLETREVDVPEWGGSVLVRGLTGRERDAYETSLTTERQTKAGVQRGVDLDNVRAKLIARCVVDEDGQRLFKDQDIAALGAKSAVALNRVYDVALELSGLTDESQEEIEGNSDAATGGDSSSV